MKLSSFFYIAVSCFLFQNGFALEATFTPSPDKDTGSTDGPLPLSQNQRNQLLQLDQQISQSPNPQETLQKVAQSNNMSAEELGSLLMRNRRDMEMAGGGGGVPGGGLSDSLPRKMIRLLSTFFLLAFKSASAHPRSASIMGLILLSTIYVLISAPRTGIVLSSRNGLMSSGHTTFLNPPTKYLSHYVSNVAHRSSLPSDLKAGSLSRLFTGGDDLDTEEINGVHVRKLSKKDKKKLSYAATARKEIPFAVLIPSEEELTMMHEAETSKNGKGDQSDEDVMEEIENKAWDHAIELAYTSACRILNKRRYSEYIATPSNRLRMYSELYAGEQRNDVAALVMKSMGNWGRYGIQPLRLCTEHDTEDHKSVVYYTLKGGQFDGELKFTIDRTNDEENEQRLVVGVTLLIPKKGRKISNKVASKILSLLAESIATSSITEAKQILSRELQSTIYRGRAKTRAAMKRHTAFENMRKMEEMAEERRRRRQRSNQNAGRYRPSGIRGPGGGPSRSF